MGKTRALKWGLLILSVAILVFIVLRITLLHERQKQTEIGDVEREDVQPPFEKKDIETLNVSQLKAYITACEIAGDYQECERAYRRAIRLTQDDKSRFRELIDLKFGLADLYVNSLWEYGQFGGEDKMPPALKRAIGIYDEIIASFPGSELAAEAQFRKGILFHNELSGYWNSLHADDAIREFQKVIEQYPETDQARRAKEKLAALQREE